MTKGKLIKPAITCEQCRQTGQHYAKHKINMATVQDGDNVNVLHILHEDTLTCRNCGHKIMLAGTSST